MVWNKDSLYADIVLGRRRVARVDGKSCEARRVGCGRAAGQEGRAEAELLVGSPVWGDSIFAAMDWAGSLPWLQVAGCAGVSASAGAGPSLPCQRGREGGPSSTLIPRPRLINGGPGARGHHARLGQCRQSCSSLLGSWDGLLASLKHQLAHRGGRAIPTTRFVNATWPYIISQRGQPARGEGHWGPCFWSAAANFDLVALVAWLGLFSGKGRDDGHPIIASSHLLLFLLLFLASASAVIARNRLATSASPTSNVI